VPAGAVVATASVSADADHDNGAALRGTHGSRRRGHARSLRVSLPGVQESPTEAAETKALERERYIAASGSPNDFEEDYPAIRVRLMAERMLERERRAAHPRDYRHGLSGGTTQPVKSTTDAGGTE
jgi:hypothetical protein